MQIKKIQKRDGGIVEFDVKKISNAIWKSFQAVEGGTKTLATKLANQVAEELEKTYDGKLMPSVEQVQDAVEIVLIDNNLAKVAKAYIIYRQKRKEMREEKTRLIGRPIKTHLSINALRVLKERYLVKDKEGNLVETPEMLFRRVADNIAEAERLYDAKTDVKEIADEFYRLMNNLEFLPNSPTLMNAGTPIQQLSACFVLPVDDDMAGIFESVKNTALIHKSGGGTGFSFSRLRAKNSRVMSTKGVASGPVSFMRVFDAATEVIKQGGKRRGANMGILNIDHPDILEFISCKSSGHDFQNFNISVGLTAKFMKAVLKDEDYELNDPHTKQPVDKLNARRVYDLIVAEAWRNGDPGIVFLDRINKANPTPHIGPIESTNPCGEQPLLPFEACNLGSINLARMLKKDDKGFAVDFDWEKLAHTTKIATRFLDNVIDVNNYPLPQITDMVKKTRKIGLGIMGWADALILLGIPYNSSKAIKLAEKTMNFIKNEADRMSSELGEKRGCFEGFEGSIYEKTGKMRNATRTTIAPTGTLSMLADCSSGIEPLFAISFIKRVMDGQDLVYIHPQFELAAQKKGFYSDDLMYKISQSASIQGFEEIPQDVRKHFVVAHDISPEWHIRMQAAFQKYTDNAVSKTINFPHSATIEDVANAYLLAYKLSCKGVTIYRDRSRENQVLNIGTSSTPEKNIMQNKEEVAPDTDSEELCPECNSKVSVTEGCMTCYNCGWSACHTA